MGKIWHPITTRLLPWHKVNIRGLLLLVLIVLWIPINFYNQQYLLGLIPVIFYLVLLFFKRPNIILVIVPILLVVFFFSRIHTAFSSIRATTLVFFDQPGQVLSTFLTPGSGLESVLEPPPARARELIQDYHMTGFRLTEGLLKFTRVKERIIESNWPITIDPGSPYIFGLPGEIKKIPGCTPIKELMEIELGYCP